MTTYTILNNMLDEVSKKIKRIVNKCEKNNIQYIFNVDNPYTKTVSIGDETFEIDLVDLDLEVMLKFNGWTSLGMIQQKDGIIQCYFDDASLIKQYKDTDFHCDHCHKKIHRNSVAILENESGERKVVGTSCVKEFTCGLDGKLIAEVNDYMNILKNRSSELNSLMNSEDDAACKFFKNNGVQTYKVVDIVSAAKRIIDKHGYVSSGNVNATWKYIMCEYDVHKVEEEAINAIEWIKSLSEDEVNKSSYLFNIRQIIDAEYCTGRHFGFLTSLIPSYNKSEYKRLLDIKNGDTKVSDYVGNVGDKINVKLTYLNSYNYCTQFGNSYIHLFVDDNGNVFKWSTNSKLEYTVKDNKSKLSQSYCLDKCAIIQLTGKIKNHSEYRGQKQTVLTICKYEVLESKDRDEKIAKLNIIATK